MTSQPIHYENYENMLSGIQGELLEALLQPEEDFYPWNPAEPEAEEYFAELERGFLLSNWQDDEIKLASQAFFNQLHNTCNQLVLSATDRLKISLSQRFADFVPQSWLDAITSRAEQIFSANLSLAEQLVLCVKPLLPNWAEEDLFVFARPLANAMRGIDSAEEELPNGIRQREWTELSQIEQVRLSLTIAHSALLQLENLSRDSEKE